jgi:hypothetical protein
VFIATFSTPNVPGSREWRLKTEYWIEVDVFKVSIEGVYHTEPTIFVS